MNAVAISLLLGSALGVSLQATAADFPPVCPPDFTPIQADPPRLPAKLHNEFQGYAVVAYTVSALGVVEDPRIIASNWQPVGHRSTEAFGYNSAVRDSVAKWVFPERSGSCTVESRVEINYSDS